MEVRAIKADARQRILLVTASSNRSPPRHTGAMPRRYGPRHRETALPLMVLATASGNLAATPYGRDKVGPAERRLGAESKTERWQVGPWEAGAGQAGRYAAGAAPKMEREGKRR